MRTTTYERSQPSLSTYFRYVFAIVYIQPQETLICTRFVKIYRSVVDEVELLVVIGHEEVEQEVYREEQVEHEPDDHPVQVVRVGESDSRGRNYAHRQQHQNYGEVPERLEAESDQRSSTLKLSSGRITK